MPIPDIQVISGANVGGSFTLPPLSGERASAALFFARLIDSHAREGTTDVARWYFRAAISEFRSIFELLPADLKAKGVSHQWNHSPFKVELDTHPLISVLKKVRNFALHSERVQGFGRNFSVTVLSDCPDRQVDIPSIFIEHLDRQRLGREINDVTAEALDWFNRQTKMYPAHLLLEEAIYQSRIQIGNFLAKAR